MAAIQRRSPASARRSESTRSSSPPEQEPEYGGWKRLGFALGHLGKIVAANARDGYFNVGLLGTCPSMPGMVAGLQRSGSTNTPLKIGLLWLDAHPDFNTPETTRSGSLGGMPVAVATGRCLAGMRQDAGLDPPLRDEHVVMAGVRLTDPLEQKLLDKSKIEQLSVEDLRTISPAVTKQLDRLSRLTDKIYVHIDMDVLDPPEVMGHGNKVPDGPTSQQLAKLFEMIFSKYPKASAIGFATIPQKDDGGLSLAAVNRMIVGAVRGLKARPAAAAPASALPKSNAFVQVSGKYARPEMLVETNWLCGSRHQQDGQDRRHEAERLRGGPHSRRRPPRQRAIRNAKSPPDVSADRRRVRGADEQARHDEPAHASSSTTIAAASTRRGSGGSSTTSVTRTSRCLNGGWTKWTKENRPTSTETPQTSRGVPSRPSRTIAGSRTPPTSSRPSTSRA